MIVYFKKDGITMRLDPEALPVAIVLTDSDKFNVSHMSPDHSVYCAYPDTMSEQEAKAFIKDIKIRELVEGHQDKL
jgi:hypothetical protein